MKAVWNRSPKLTIKRSTRPQEGLNLSGVVLLSEGGQTSFAYVKFDNTVVERIGKHMPYGIGPEHPAYLHILWNGYEYEIKCRYVGNNGSRLLWRSESLPEFIGKIRHASKKKRKYRAPSSAP